MLWTVLAGVGLLLLMLVSLRPGQSGVSFEKISLSRNENNTGPIQRTYLIAVSDSSWPELEAYAAALPYTPLGETRAFFFLAGQPHPEHLSWQAEDLPPAWRAFCLASYERGPQGDQHFRLRP